MNLTLVKDRCHFRPIRIGGNFIYAQLLQLSAKCNAAFWLIEVSEHAERLHLDNRFDFSRMFQLRSLKSKPSFCEAGSLLSHLFVQPRDTKKKTTTQHWQSFALIVFHSRKAPFSPNVHWSCSLNSTTCS